jgi:acyl-[acyl-carrier-protein] desaturase
MSDPVGEDVPATELVKASTPDPGRGLTTEGSPMPQHRPMSELSSDLTPVVEQLLERHIATAKEWFPHRLVPWSRGRDFVDDEWSPEPGSCSDSARVALTVNLLTEDNLPYYTESLSDGRHDGAWAEWSRRWTAEEGRHAIVIRDYLTVTRAIDPVALERGRMQQVSAGVIPSFEDPCRALVYTSLQELATRVAHRNTGELLADPAGRTIMRRVAADENLHHLFYRDLASAAIERDPSAMVIAMNDVVRGFAMPGTGIADFARLARVIAAAGVYDFSIHYHQIVVPVVLQRWRLAELDGLTSDAAQARDRLLRFVERLGKVADRTDARREANAGAAIQVA